MKYMVKSGRWGEGWKPGDVIDIDLDAAKVRLELGELVEVKDGKIVEKLIEVKEEVVEEVVSAAAPEMVSEDVVSVTENVEVKPKRGRPKVNKV